MTRHMQANLIGRFALEEYERATKTNNPRIFIQRAEKIEYQLDRWFLQKRGMKMTKKRQLPDNFGNYSFVDILLSDSDKKLFVQWYQDNMEDFDDILGAVITDDYKLSVSFDFAHSTYIASLTGRDGNKVNPFRVLTARHQSVSEAIMLVVYKHVVMGQSGTWEGNAPGASWG